MVALRSAVVASAGPRTFSARALQVRVAVRPQLLEPVGIDLDRPGWPSSSRAASRRSSRSRRPNRSSVASRRTAGLIDFHWASTSRPIDGSAEPRRACKSRELDLGRLASVEQPRSRHRDCGPARPSPSSSTAASRAIERAVGHRRAAPRLAEKRPDQCRPVDLGGPLRRDARRREPRLAATRTRIMRSRVGPVLRRSDPRRRRSAGRIAPGRRSAWPARRARPGPTPVSKKPGVARECLDQRRRAC